MTDPRIIALSSNPGQVEPGPFSEYELRWQWNAQADPSDPWDESDLSEKLAWAQTRAIASVQFPHDGPAAPAAKGVLDDRYEFSVVDSDDCEQAGGSAPTLDDAIREGRNYLRQYNQDGPHKLELRRVLVLGHSEATDDHA